MRLIGFLFTPFTKNPMSFLVAQTHADFPSAPSRSKIGTCSRPHPRLSALAGLLPADVCLCDTMPRENSWPRAHLCPQNVLQKTQDILRWAQMRTTAIPIAACRGAHFLLVACIVQLNDKNRTDPYSSWLRLMRAVMASAPYRHSFAEFTRWRCTCHASPRVSSCV